MDATCEINGTTFVWNMAKALMNERKHGVRFDQAAEAFFDPFFRLVDAGRHKEARDAVIGYDADGRLLFVVHLLLQDNAIRIVSARKATAEERKTYDS